MLSFHGSSVQYCQWWGRKMGTAETECCPAWTMKVTSSSSAAHVERVPASESKEIATCEEAKIGCMDTARDDF